MTWLLPCEKSNTVLANTNVKAASFDKAEHSMLAAKITLTLFFTRSAKHFLSKLSSHHTFVHYVQQYPIKYILYMLYKHHPNPKNPTK